jgi:hypothetical protein
LTLDEEIGGLSVRDETVLEHVVRSDKVRERLMREAESRVSLFSKRIPPTGILEGQISLLTY